MKKELTILMLTVLPLFTLATGNYAHGHGEKNSQQEVVSKPGDPAKVDRVIDISMDDSMRFTPDKISVKTGETIRFFIKNKGKLTHEMIIGSREELEEHAAMMRQMPGMKHTEPNMIRLKPGQRGGIVWQFEKTGSVDFACLVPGHSEAGMVGTIHVQN